MTLTEKLKEKDPVQPLKIMNAPDFFAGSCFHLAVSRYIEVALGGTINTRS